MNQRIRVLIAGAQPSARAGINALLTLYPEFEITGLASDGHEAVFMAAEYKPDVILIDLQMPVTDEMEATRQIKGRWPGIPIIALTMYSSDGHEAQKAGADAFVLKGFEPETLREVILQTRNSSDKNPLTSEHTGL